MTATEEVLPDEVGNVGVVFNTICIYTPCVSDSQKVLLRRQDVVPDHRDPMRVTPPPPHETRAHAWFYVSHGTAVSYIPLHTYEVQNTAFVSTRKCSRT